MAVCALFIFVISFDPPGGPTFDEAKKSSSSTEVLKPRLQRHQYWLMFGFGHFAKYSIFQLCSWAMWTVSGLRGHCGIVLLMYLRRQGGLIYRLIVGILQIFPQTINLIMFGISKWMCESVEVYREMGACPTLDF